MGRCSITSQPFCVRLFGGVRRVRQVRQYRERKRPFERKQLVYRLLMLADVVHDNGHAGLDSAVTDGLFVFGFGFLFAAGFRRRLGGFGLYSRRFFFRFLLRLRRLFGGLFTGLFYRCFGLGFFNRLRLRRPRRMPGRLVVRNVKGVEPECDRRYQDQRKGKYLSGGAAPSFVSSPRPSPAALS